MAYISIMIGAAKTADRARYTAFSEKFWELLREDGAISGKDCWGSDVPDGKLTSFPMAVKLEPDETVVASWIVWPDKATADTAWGAMDSDPRWQAFFAQGMAMDGPRMIFGGFEEVAGF